MTENEMVERGLYANENGLVLDSDGNEYRDEQGCISYVDKNQYPLPVGANVLIKWYSGGRESCYFSFGQYDEEKNEDEFGYPDDYIFYYCPMGEVEMAELTYDATHDTGSDFWVVEYELVFKIGCHN